MKRIDPFVIILSTLATVSINACRNTISNNTNTTFKIAEVKQENTDLKQQHILPDDYLKDEKRACTLRPGEEADFGGHYLPKYIIYKEYQANNQSTGSNKSFYNSLKKFFGFDHVEHNKQWRPLLYIKQTKCAPDGADPSRFPENKYLLMTDLLNRQLPDDYQEVYAFVVKAPLQELAVQSSNEKTLKKLKNPYQELNVILDDMTQKVLELFSNTLQEIPDHKVGEKRSVDHKMQSGDTRGKDEAEACDMCSLIPAAA